MKQNAKSDKPLALNSHVLENFKTWENLVSGEISNSDTRLKQINSTVFKIYSKIVFFFILLLK